MPKASVDASKAVFSKLAPGAAGTLTVANGNVASKSTNRSKSGKLRPPMVGILCGSEPVNAANVILKEPQRLKDLPVTYHNERAETSEFNALCEFYRRCVSYSLVDSSVAEATSE